MSRPKVSGWLLLAASLPGQDAGTARVRLWRALKDAGAASLRDGVTVVPATPAIRERLGEIARDIESAGGSAWVFEVPSQSPASEKNLKVLFDRSDLYNALAPAISKLRREIAACDEPEARVELRDIERDFQAIVDLDFFPGAVQTRLRSSLNK